MKNVIVILFFWLTGVIMGSYYFYAVGRNDINHRLVVSSFNNGFMTGYKICLMEMNND